MILLWIMLGFLLYRCGVQKADGAQVLSKLELYIFMPCMMFSAFAADVTRADLLDKSVYLLWGSVLAAATYVLGRVFAAALSKEPYQRSVFVFEFLIPNYGFIGYALIETLYGEDMLLNTVIFSLPLTLYACTGGYRSLCCGKRLSVKDVCNPSLLAVFAGILVVALGIPVPVVLQSVIQTGKGAVAPLGMLLVGMVLAEFDLKKLLREKALYAASALRLLVLPCMICLLLKLVHAPEPVVIIAALFYTLPAGLNPVIYAKFAGRDCHTGAGMLLITNAAVLITMPLLVRMFLK